LSPERIRVALLGLLDIGVFVAADASSLKVDGIPGIVGIRGVLPVPD
jgi:hypothetical protein